MTKAFVELRNQRAQKTEHIAFNVRVGVFVDRQTAGRVLREQNADAFFRARIGDDIFDFARNINHFLALHRVDFDYIHRKKYEAVEPRTDTKEHEIKKEIFASFFLVTQFLLQSLFSRNFNCSFHFNFRRFDRRFVI